MSRNDFNSSDKAGTASKKSSALAVFTVFINWSAPCEKQEKSRAGEGREEQSREDAKEQGSGKRGNGPGRPLGRKRRTEYAGSGQFSRRPATAGGGGLRLKFIFVFGEVVGHGENATPWPRNCLEKPKDSLDGYPSRNDAARGIMRRHKFPATNDLLGAFIKAQADSFDDADLRRASVGANQYFQRHGSL